ncbi:MAG TPA: ATP phosphoribosyltransferase regulatory subunit [Terriglobia bacterium]|nr:ATP phosphoribosyltransferase regulatory subunit [Terriglobia bacterium]
MIQAIRGTYDVLPGDVEICHAVEARLRDVFHRNGFGEIRTPVFEATELFVRGVGEETDIVSKEMYTFADRDQSSLTLRPEGTAPVMRAYLDFDARSLKSQMRLADKLKAVLILGDEELKSGTVVLRDMSTKEQRNIKEEELL